MIKKIIGNEIIGAITKIIFLIVVGQLVGNKLNNKFDISLNKLVPSFVAVINESICFNNDFTRRLQFAIKICCSSKSLFRIELFDERS